MKKRGTVQRIHSARTLLRQKEERLISREESRAKIVRERWKKVKFFVKHVMILPELTFLRAECECAGMLIILLSVLHFFMTGTATSRR